MSKPKEHKRFDMGQTVYVTKYALTTGIRTETFWKTSEGGFHWVDGHMYVFSDEHVWATPAAAQQKAREMAERALKALAKKRAHLESIVKNGAKVVP